MPKCIGGVHTLNDRPVAAERSSRSLLGSGDGFENSSTKDVGQSDKDCAQCRFGKFRPRKRTGYCRARPTIPALASGVILSDAQTGMRGGHRWTTVGINEVCWLFERRGNGL
jgi:hypothetical protein